jgi:N-acyl-D-aspartate/D-glutamate deacylase
MYDLLVTDGLVADGTGIPSRYTDIAVKDGRIVAMGRLKGEQARRTIDATGLVVAPGIVDAHTHYDPQLTWDPYCDTSNLHGVTTVVAGNCGFSVAPCRPEDRGYLAQMFAKVEGMDIDAFEHVNWDFETFPELMKGLEGRIGMNVGMYIGHSAIRRYVMGDASFERASTPEELEQIAAITDEAMQAGAMGWSSAHAPVHFDLAGRPVPSRLADLDELRLLADVVGRYGRGSIGYAPFSSMEGINRADRELMIELARRSGVPVVTQGLGGRSKIDAPDLAWQEAAAFLDESTAAGAPVYCLLMVYGNNGIFTFEGGTSRYEGVPTWHALFSLPVEKRLARMADPTLRAEFRHAIDNPNKDASKGNTIPPPIAEIFMVEEAFAPENQKYVGRAVGEIAQAEGRHVADVVLDIAVADKLKTVFHWNSETKAWHEVLREAQRHPNMLVGVSDGGAHLDRQDGASWSTHFLLKWWKEERLWRLEEAIRLMTSVPAAACGIPHRGVLQTGFWGDMMIFDPDGLGYAAGPDKEQITGLPRFRATATGFKATIVNGVPIVEDGKVTGETPGQLVVPA